MAYVQEIIICQGWKKNTIFLNRQLINKQNKQGVTTQNVTCELILHLRGNAIHQTEDLFNASSDYYKHKHVYFNSWSPM